MTSTTSLPQAPPRTETPVPAIPHFGKAFLSPQEAAEHAAFEAWARLFHRCPHCDGRNQFERCQKCERRGYLFPRAVAERLGVARFLYAEEGRVSQG